MSTRRTMLSAYRQEQPRGPHGERLCRWCRNPVRPPRRTYCSDGCVHEWRLRTSPGYVRRCVVERDRGVCAVCGLDAQALERELTALWWRDRTEYRRRCRELGLPGDRVVRHLWEADHIIPVAEGGGECGLDNYRTLCIWCHRQETAALNRRLREQRARV